MSETPGATAAPSRASVTRTALLDSGRAVFVDLGYVDASVTSIVERAGASVGSLYHHFGGKPDIFIALYEQYEARVSCAAAEAVAAARDAGETDPVELFVHGARGYLRQSRIDKDLAGLFLQGDGPPGFNTLRRRMAAEWVRQNSRLIRADERHNGEALVTVLTTVSGAAGREVAAAEDDAAADVLIEDFCELLARVAAP
ncbi:TetR family transcriptional regulator [Epidermidibacterium keratini]|uniref:TetR family transcriptional regulator n=2 Tax=Epidermidibacterium keratini TaxID=1891644 RepID=A0A7L4YU34_9ACTN|nr:TetR family transcriptional regulator [Epidermidibacterium keratini]